jgi:hypothetical protein
MLKYVLIIQYYKLPINEYKFVTDESYLEEYVKQNDFKECLKRFDEEENVVVEGFEFINNKVKIKYKGKLLREYNIDFNIDINKDISNSITTIAEETPVVVNDNELKVTESEVNIKKEKKKKEKRKRTDKDQEIIKNSIALAAEQIPAVVDDIIVLPDSEVPPAFMVIKGKTYRLRKKAEVNYESEDEDGIKEEEEYVNRSEDNNEGEEGNDEIDKIKESKKYKRKKGEDRKYKTFETSDLTTKKDERC